MALVSTVMPDRAAAAAEAVSQARSAYRLRLASSAADVRAAQALRFVVFNVELGEGLARSYEHGRDEDAFDPVCDHLIVEHDGAVVGTYRLQTGARAKLALGYYSEREFDFSPFESRRGEILELGRACVHPAHRSFAVLSLLWRGIAAYAERRGLRWLLGCSSLTTQDEAVGAAAHRQLQRFAADAEWRTAPRQAFACRLDAGEGVDAEIPKLLAAYLALGARICAAPAIDREFGTIDFLTGMDLRSPGAEAFLLRGRVSRTG